MTANRILNNKDSLLYTVHSLAVYSADVCDMNIVTGEGFKCGDFVRVTITNLHLFRYDS